ncbi:hypothetical protein PENPOL_c001G10257 [Penicillium polonicum]|uniref:Uncharacterized protein n=1 Tax=Penicillium polonicum TaxID=60169 RepID=A0A1V6P2T6_PENPO|nr:hypothetical protein PENPOL_c001G10257 [Penicillium polonicum]
MQPTSPSPPYSIIPSIEIEDEGTLSTIVTTDHQAWCIQPNHSRRAPRVHQCRDIRSANPSPESTQEERPQVVVRVNRVPNGKRKSTPVESVGGLPRTKKKKANTKQNEMKRFCWELGQRFTGVVSPIDGDGALDIASNIARDPVPTNVFKRLVDFCDASRRAP